MLTALNGGPQFTFSEAVSFQVFCKDQSEIDYFWQALSADGGSEGPCGWLKDKYGVSWQVAPENMGKFFSDSDPEARERTMAAMLQMKKIIVADLEAAAQG
jgi:predicted 3-demethylubiquinone-9 3-methyltransferase (glyoxalase superfamily)